jgi:hypothetical protein
MLNVGKTFKFIKHYNRFSFGSSLNLSKQMIFSPVKSFCEKHAQNEKSDLIFEEEVRKKDKHRTDFEKMMRNFMQIYGESKNKTQFLNKIDTQLYLKIKSSESFLQKQENLKDFLQNLLNQLVKEQINSIYFKSNIKNEQNYKLNKLLIEIDKLENSKREEEQVYDFSKSEMSR